MSAGRALVVVRTLGKDEVRLLVDALRRAAAESRSFADRTMRPWGDHGNEVLSDPGTAALRAAAFANAERMSTLAADQDRLAAELAEAVGVRVEGRRR